MGEWLTIAEAARLVGVTATTLRRWDREGRLTAVRHPISGYRLYPRDRLSAVVPSARRPAHLLGRDRELAAVSAALDEHRLVVLTGPPGIGKTRIADAVLASRPGSIAVDCSDVDDLPGFLAAVGRAVGSPSDLPDHLGSLLGLDNLEQLVDAGVPAVLRTWLERAPTLRILATSREALQIGEEHPIAVDALEDDPAVRLLRRSCDWGVADLRALVHRLEGNPLALELAAAQAAVLGPRELGALLDRSSVSLRTERRDLPLRHRSVEAAVRTSIERLSAPARSALSQLLVFRGGFDADAACAVLDLSPWPGVGALDVVRALAGSSLLRRWSACPGSFRHAPWVIVRDVVEATTPPPPDAAVRHAIWLRDRLATHPPFAAVHAELANFRAALARTQLPAELRAELLTRSWDATDRLLPDERIAHADALLRDFPDGSALSSRVRHVRATALLEAARTDEAAADLARGIASAPSPTVGAELELTLVTILLRQGREPEAEGLLDRAETALVGPDDDALRTRAAAARALLVLSRDGPAAALEPLREAVRRGRRLGRPGLELWSLAVLARQETNLAIGRLDGCLRAVALAREQRSALLEAYALETVGLQLQESGALEQAEATFREAVALSALHGLHHQGASARIRLAVALLEDGRAGEAEAEVVAAALALTSGPLADRSRALQALAAHLGGDPERAGRLIPGDVRSDAARDTVQVLRRLRGDPSAAPASEAHGTDPLVRAVLRIERERSAPHDRRWAYGPDGSWFRSPGGIAVDLSDRGSLRRILAALVASERPVPPADLIEAGWPGARLVGDSGLKRVRSAVWTLRRLGLELLTTRDGYALVGWSGPTR